MYHIQVFIAIHSDIHFHRDAEEDRHFYRLQIQEHAGDRDGLKSHQGKQRQSFRKRSHQCGLPGSCHSIIHQGMHHRQSHLCPSLISTPISAPGFEHETHVPCLIPCVSHIGHVALHMLSPPLISGFSVLDTAGQLSSKGWMGWRFVMGWVLFL